MMLKKVEKTTIGASRLWVVALLAVAAGTALGQENPIRQPQALDWAGIYALRQADPNLTGTGVRMGVICRSLTYDQNGKPQNDYQPNLRHNCFQNAQLQFHDDATDAPGLSAHTTAICSILFGDESQATASYYLEPFPYQGALPAAEGQIYEFWHFVVQHVNDQKMPPVDVATASFGWPLEDWWTRGIEALIEHEGLVFVASIGNGTNASDPLFYPGAGANAIGVGVVSSVNTEDPATKLAHFALAYPEESSVGPTEDGRCKPDLIAPGNCLVAETDADEGYTMGGNWSSFSTPVAAGVVGLLVQAARQDASLSPVLSAGGGNLVLKAILMTSATKLPHWHKGRLGTEDDHEAPLDYAQGAGMVNAVRAYQLLKAGQGSPGAASTAGWDLNQLDAVQTPQQVYRIIVDEPAGKVLTATLAWNRHYRREYPFQRMSDGDSDLRLEVWGIDPANPNSDPWLEYSDSRVDNVEHIHIEMKAERTVYEIVVSYGNPDGRTAAPVNERYALAWGVAEKPADDSFLRHDLNADGIVNEQDLGILMDNLVKGSKSPEAYVMGDVNMDGVIDTKDVEAIIADRNRRAQWLTDGAVN